MGDQQLVREERGEEAVYSLNDAIKVYFTQPTMSKVPTIRLNNGLQQPAVSFGTFAVSFFPLFLPRIE